MDEEERALLAEATALADGAPHPAQAPTGQEDVNMDLDEDEEDNREIKVVTDYKRREVRYARAPPLRFLFLEVVPFTLQTPGGRQWDGMCAGSRWCTPMCLFTSSAVFVCTPMPLFTSSAVDHIFPLSSIRLHVHVSIHFLNGRPYLLPQRYSPASPSSPHKDCKPMRIGKPAERGRVVVRMIWSLFEVSCAKLMSVAL
jgi:hypothetical protein